MEYDVDQLCRGRINSFFNQKSVKLFSQFVTKKRRKKKAPIH